MQMSPIKVFLALLGALAAITVVVLVTRPAATNTIPPSEATVSFDHSLTDAEAIERFKELKSLRSEAYREADLSLVDLIYTTESPARRTVVSEIRRLQRNGVFSRTRFDTKQLDVLENSPSKIEIREIVVVFPKFVDEDGNDVTKRGRVERREVNWILHAEDANWLVYRSVIVAARKIRAR